MNKILNFLKNSGMRKKVLIVVIFIILIVGVWSIWGPTIKLMNNLNKINGTTFSLEKSKKCVAYNGNCKINVYPTERLKEINLIQDKRDDRIIYLCVDSYKSSDKGSAYISILPTNEANAEFLRSMNELENVKEPMISSETNTLNYFIYNGKNYYYNINKTRGILVATPINARYLYWVMITDYKNLTREDIESILFFETK